VRRREFITLLGSVAAAWPFEARTQQNERMRRIGVLMPVNEDEPDNRSGSAAFVQMLNQLAAARGYKIPIDTKWGATDPAAIRRRAEQLIALAPDVLVTSGDATAGPVVRLTHTVPVVFNNVTDPVGAGFVGSLAEPGGNATGFLRFEYTLAGKWLELLKLIAPRMTRVAVLRDSDTAGGIGKFAVIQSVAPSLGIDVRVINLHDAREIERDIASFARNAEWWAGPDGKCATGHSQLRPSNPQGREAVRPAAPGAEQVRPRNQSQDCQGAQPHHPAFRPRARR
jgi:putative tryptophan/tyrosine transport system substrate-binding protein